MKNVFCAFLILFSIVPASAGWAEGPELVVKDANYDFGQVYAGKNVEHTFVFKNNGDAPLVVEKVRSSCGCTGTLLSSSTIEPGEMGELKTTFDSTRFGGQSVTKTVYLYTNDTRQKVAQLYIRGFVEREIVMEPARVELGILAAGETREAYVNLFNQGERELTFSTIQVNTRELEVEISTERLAPGESAGLTIRATPRPNRARLNAYVIVKSGDPNGPQLRIPVSGMVAKGS